MSIHSTPNFSWCSAGSDLPCRYPFAQPGFSAHRVPLTWFFTPPSFACPTLAQGSASLDPFHIQLSSVLPQHLVIATTVSSICVWSSALPLLSDLCHLSRISRVWKMIWAAKTDVIWKTQQNLVSSWKTTLRSTADPWTIGAWTAWIHSHADFFQ